MKKGCLFLCLFLMSCTAIKQIAKEEIVTKQECSTIFFSGKVPLVSLEIDSKKSNFIFDTGATASCLVDSTIVENFGNKKFGLLTPAKGADGKKAKVKLMTFRVHSDLFDSENKVLSYINMPVSDCDKLTRNYSGIIGLDVFFDKDFSMQLDFTNNKVCNITNKQLQQNLIDNKYQLIKSECKQNQIFVYLKMEGKEMRFKLDTGYTGNIITPFSEGPSLMSKDKMELEGSLYKTVSSFTTGKEILYEKIPVVFAGENLLVKTSISSSIKSQIIGISFIKCYDWLIDYNHNKVYVKRNQNPIESKFNRRVMYYAKVESNQLKVIVKEKSQTKYHLGDKIVAVNNQKVTAENNCQLQDLLNTTEDWNTLQLNVLPGSP